MKVKGSVLSETGRDKCDIGVKNTPSDAFDEGVELNIQANNYVGDNIFIIKKVTGCHEIVGIASHESEVSGAQKISLSSRGQLIPQMTNPGPGS